MSAVELSPDTAQDSSSNCPEIEHDPPQNSSVMEKEEELKETSKDSCSKELDMSAENRSAEADANTQLNEEADLKNNDDLKASLNAIFARKDSKSKPVLDKVEEKKVAEEKEKIEEEEVVKKNDTEDVSGKEETDTSENSAVRIVVPDIVVEKTTDDSKQGMKSSEDKKPRFAFFKKSKKSAELSVDSDTKSDNGSGKSGGFTRRNKSFNPFKSVRKAVNKYRSTRRPAPEVQLPPVIVEPEPIDPEKLEELQQEVCVVSDIRKNRPKGPQGRKRRSMRPVSTADGSETGTPVTAQLQDLLNGDNQTDCLSNGNNLSVDHVTEKSRDAPGELSVKTGDPPESDLVKSDVGNLAASSQPAEDDTDKLDTDKVDTDKSDIDIVVSKEVKTEVSKDISVEGEFCTSALGNSCSVAEDES
ncbi:hypothetical protein ACHWQZ_G003287 [Mnemiopsis leidyi]